MPESSAYGLGPIRRGLRDFTVGKTVTATLGFASFALIAIVLPVTEYGAYVTFVAALDLMVALSTFGVDWVAVRFIPEYRTHASTDRMRRFVMLLAALRLALLLAVALIWWIVLGLFLSYFRMEQWHPVALIYLFVLLTEGLARFLRDQVLDSFLKQGLSQFSLAARSGMIVAVLGYAALVTHDLTLAEIALLELIASVVGLAVAVGGCVRALLAAGQTENASERWEPPKHAVMVRLAYHSYASMVIAMLYGTQVMLMLASRMLGMNGAAVFGFARNLSEQVRRYLPASLFVGLIRPAIIARYADSGDFGRLNRHAVLIHKLSLFCLAPVLVFFVVFGESCLNLLSGDKYGGAQVYTVGLLLVLIPFSHRQVLEMVVNTVDRPQLWSRASVISLITLPIAALLVLAGLGLWGLIAAMFVAEVVANMVLVRGLKRYGMRYRLDGGSGVRIVLAAVATMLILAPFPEIEPTLPQVALAGVASVLAFLAVAYVLKPFNTRERDALNRLISKPLFCW